MELLVGVGTSSPPPLELVPEHFYGYKDFVSYARGRFLSHPVTYLFPLLIMHLHIQLCAASFVQHGVVRFIIVLVATSRSFQGCAMFHCFLYFFFPFLSQVISIFCLFVCF